MTRGVSLAGKGLKLSFRKSTFSLDVPWVEAPAGKVLALLGPSGSGKTTLLEVLGLLAKPNEGQVLLDGASVEADDRSARLQMAAVFQRPYLFKGSVADNVAYGLVARGAPRSDRADRVKFALDRVGLSGYEDRSALQLSGGEAQRVSLARALVVEPRVLLLDEPLASLDPLLKRTLTQDFASILREAGVTVVYVCHDQDEALVVAHRVAIMLSGRVVACGDIEDVMGLPGDDWTAAFLGVEEATLGTITSAQDGLTTIDIVGTPVYASGEGPVGSQVTFAVRPEDVLIFEADAELPPTTARNRLPAAVVSVAPKGATNHVVLEASGVRLAASVSRASTTEMALSPGTRVLAVFKASAVRWRVAEDAPGSILSSECAPAGEIDA